MSQFFTAEDRRMQEEKGFSLLELLLVVGVGALLLLAGIATYRLVMQGNNVNDAVRTLATIKQQTQRAFQGQPSYGSADLVPTLVTMNAFPAGVLNTSSTPIHPWGGNIAIVGADQNFTVTFQQVPSDSCVQLANTFNTGDTDFFSLSIGGTVYARGAVMDPVTVAGSCGTGGNVDMIWSFF